MSEQRPAAAESVEAAEDDVWPHPAADATDLMRRVHRLRRVPLVDLDSEGLRTLLSQRVGLAAIVPIAVSWLTDQPLLAGDFYPGDVLVALLRLEPTFWADHPVEADLLRVIVARVDRDDSDYPVDSDLSLLSERFLGGT